MPLNLYAQYQKTVVKGVTLEVINGDTVPLPFVQVWFEGTNNGTTSDVNGQFEISNTVSMQTVSFSMVGYRKKLVRVKGERVNTIRVVMEEEAYTIKEVLVKPSRRRKGYRRKGNPAVELAQHVIDNKNKNRVGYSDTYMTETYEKLSLAIEPFDYDLDKTQFRRNFKFLTGYLDTMIISRGALMADTSSVRMDTIWLGEDSMVVNERKVQLVRNSDSLSANETTILTLSLRETLAKEYYQDVPKKQRKIETAKRWNGLDILFDNGGLNENLQEIFKPVNILNNNVGLLLNKFVSPLSSTLATTFYYFDILDTLMIDGQQCIDLGFVPMNSESFGFTGHLYIVNDTTYALKRYKLNVPVHINLNWVNFLSIEETFKQLPTGQWASETLETHASFGITKKSKHNFYARQTRRFMNYELGASIPDSLFYMQGATITLPDAQKHTRAEWDTLRPVPLTGKETMVDSLTTELMRVPSFRALVNTVQDMIQEFIPTSHERDSSKWDFGPIFNTISYNEQEGLRLRVGGMTTANTHPRWFFAGYAAYGFTDRRVKGGLTLLHSFHPKKYHPYETLRHNLSLSLSYDLEELGQSYRVLDRDHIFMSIKFNYSCKPMQYIGRIRLKYEKEFANQFSIITWFDYMHNQPNGASFDVRWGNMRWDRSPYALRYIKRLDDGSVIETPWYHDAMWTFQLRYSPGGHIYNDRQGIESPFNLWKDAPVFRFTNEMGMIIEDNYFYNRIQFSAEKRFWLSAFGHLDGIIDIGYVAGNKIPYTKLFVPMSNTSILLDPKAFNLMQPMEFLTDRYIAWHLTYYLKGWIFNRIPGLKRLKLREVISFHGLAGYLADHNNPDKTFGLYDLPYTYSSTDANGNVQYMKSRTSFRDGPYIDSDGNVQWRNSYMPYMEITAGIENIFKLIRIDYIRRLTHINAAPGQKIGVWQRNGIRITIRATI